MIFGLWGVDQSLFWFLPLMRSRSVVEIQWIGSFCKGS
nr:MAG TPA: hypothetical protein [Bacteriophage sp.]